VKALGLDVLKPLFQYQMVAHNALFELKHLYHAGIEVPQMHCTLLIYNVLARGRESLKYLAEKYLREKISKDEQDSDWGQETLSPQQITYAAKDAVLVLRLYDILKHKLKDRPQEKLYELLRQAQYPVMKLEYYGCGIDAGKLAGFLIQREKQVASAKIACQKLMGKNMNLNSSPQISGWLKKNLTKADLAKWPKTETGHLKTDDTALQKYKHLPFVSPLAEYKGLSKLHAIGKGFIEHLNPVTGRIHASFMIGGANTGRFTCRKPNLQNTPRDKEIRALFIATKGYKLVSADYSQVELRILAMIANEKVMLKAYEDGKDLHRLTASKISGIPFDEVTSEQRRAAKAINFGLVFGMGAESLAEYARATYGVKMSVAEAKKARKTYFQTYPGIQTWHKKTTAHGKARGFIRTPSGRCVAMEGKAFTRSKNAPIQAGAAEVLIAALIELDKAISKENLDVRIVNMVHDEIVLEAVEDQAEQAKDLLERAMISGMLQIFPQACTKDLVEAAIGDNWGETK
jgi:DNA polymerase-1